MSNVKVTWVFFLGFLSARATVLFVVFYCRVDKDKDELVRGDTYGDRQRYHVRAGSAWDRHSDDRRQQCQ